MRAVTYTHRPKISIHAAREGGDGLRRVYANNTHISIHAAREGGDENGVPNAFSQHNFNPRRP